MRNDPKLARVSVQINYTADDGYKSECGYKSGKGVKSFEGDPTKPESAMLGGFAELARLAALFGFEADARTAADEAFARVAEWRAQRTQEGEKP